MLNLIIILGCMGFLFVLPYALLAGFSNLHTDAATYGFAAAWSGVVAMTLVGCNLWQQSLPNKNGDNWLVTPPGVILSAVLPAVLAAIFASVWVFHPDRTEGDGLAALEHVSVLLLILLGIWLVSTVFGHRHALCSQSKQVYRLARRGKKRWLWEKLFDRKSAFWTLSKETFRFALAGAVGLLAGALMLIGLAAGWRGMADEDQTYQLVLRVALGPPAVLVTLGVATSVYTGLVGRVFFERSREWWSRLNAWLLIAAVVWVLWGALAFFSLPLLQWAHGQLGTWISLLGTGWIGALLTSILFKKPASASEKTQMRVESVLDVAAKLFVIGLLFLAAAFASWVLIEGWQKAPSSEDGRAEMAFDFKAADLRVDYTLSPGIEGGEAIQAVVSRHMAKTAHLIKPESTYFGVPRPAAALLLLGIIVLLFGLCVDINKFSLHNMYKNRLVRCYLGASNEWRDEQRFTGLDDKDDVPLRDLRAEGGRVQRPEYLAQHFSRQQPGLAGAQGGFVRVDPVVLRLLTGTNARRFDQQRRAELEDAGLLFDMDLCGGRPGRERLFSRHGHGDLGRRGEPEHGPGDTACARVRADDVQHPAGALEPQSQGGTAEGAKSPHGLRGDDPGAVRVQQRRPGFRLPLRRRAFRQPRPV